MNEFSQIVTESSSRKSEFVLLVDEARIMPIEHDKTIVVLSGVDDNELEAIVEAFGVDRILDYIGTKAINDFLK